jgi:hypothetical protein
MSSYPAAYRPAQTFPVDAATDPSAPHADQLLALCFPDRDQLLPRAAPFPPLLRSFVLTDATGARFYGARWARASTRPPIHPPSLHHPTNH